MSSWHQNNTRKHPWSDTAESTSSPDKGSWNSHWDSTPMAEPRGRTRAPEHSQPGHHSPVRPFLEVLKLIYLLLRELQGALLLRTEGSACCFSHTAPHFQEQPNSLHLENNLVWRTEVNPPLDRAKGLMWVYKASPTHKEDQLRNMASCSVSSLPGYPKWAQARMQTRGLQLQFNFGHHSLFFLKKHDLNSNPRLPQQ